MDIAQEEAKPDGGSDEEAGSDLEEYLDFVSTGAVCAGKFVDPAADETVVSALADMEETRGVIHDAVETLKADKLKDHAGCVPDGYVKPDTMWVSSGDNKDDDEVEAYLK